MPDAAEVVDPLGEAAQVAGRVDHQISVGSFDKVRVRSE